MTAALSDNQNSPNTVWGYGWLPMGLVRLCRLLGGYPFKVKDFRYAVLLCILEMTIALPGCGTPITISDDHFGLGFFRLQRENLNEHVQYRHIEGLGLLLIDGRVILGYANLKRVLANLNGSSFHVTTPLGEIAVGAEAERLALDPYFVLIDHPE